MLLPTAPTCSVSSGAHCVLLRGLCHDVRKHSLLRLPCNPLASTWREGEEGSPRCIHNKAASVQRRRGPAAVLQGDLSSEDTGDGDRVWETTWDTSARVQLARNTSDARRYQETMHNDGKHQPGPHITMQAPTDSVRSVCKSGEIRIASEQMLTHIRPSLRVRNASRSRHDHRLPTA